MRFVPFWLFKTNAFQAFLYHVYFRFYCPHPIGDYTTARQCFESGCCGCNNADRFR